MHVGIAMVVLAIVAIAVGRTPGHNNPSVLAALMGAVIVTELLSACLLFGQFLEIRQAWLAAVGAAYLFSGECIIGYLLTFPHVFSTNGFFGANEQTSLSLWLVWHAAFPLGLVVASVLKNKSRSHPLTRRRARRTLGWLTLSCTMAAAIAVWLVSRNAHALPVMLDAHGFTPLTVRGILPLISLLDVAALALLLKKRASTTLELWLPIALLASLLDAVMGVISERYSIVWYTGKFFAVASSSVMLTVFLAEIARISKALAQATLRLRAVSDHIARHDAVTNLPNRAALQERMDDALLRAREHGNRTALFHVNLDRFRIVNEAVGTAAGDQLLREFGRRIGEAAGRESFVACTCGADFVVLPTAARTPKDVAARVNDIMASLRQPYIVGGRRIFPSASIGISVAPVDADDAEALLDAAATAMHLAKSSGGNQFRFYCSSMHTAAIEQLDMEADLRSALRRRQFRVYYQPIVDITTRRTVSAEALLRWEHPRHGLVAPDKFIPAAELNGTIIQIGAWVLDTVARQVRNWQEQGTMIPVAVNVSAREFQDPAFYDRVAATITRNRIDPALLTIEVTESLAIDDSDETKRTFARCRELGVGLSLDDFGTSHACLASVKRLPINTLKIDKAFVAELATNRTDAAIATAILSFAKSLGLTTVAEGIETVEQLEWLRSAGCGLGQGFLFSRPVPAAEFEQHLGAERRIA